MATWQDIAKIVTDAAPMVGGALGGPAGATLGAAVKVVAGLFGITKDDPTPDELNSVMVADPEMALKLKQADYQFTIEMRKIDREELLAVMVDIQNARGRQIEHEKATGHTDYNLYILAWVIVLGFFAIIYALMRTTVFVDDAQPVLFMLLGTLASGFGMVLQFFFGSTKSSSSKNDLLASSVPMADVRKMMLGEK